MHKFVSLGVLSLFFVGVFFVVFVFGSVSASELVEDSWSSKASMRVPRVGLGVVAVEGKIYAIGGSTTPVFYSTNLVDVNQMYDPISDTWTYLAPMPTSRSHFAIATYQNKIYCIGGIAGTISYNWNGLPSYGYVLSNVTEVYDITTNSWSTVASFPYNASRIRAAVVDDHIFVLLGSYLLSYDPLTDSWSEKTKMPATPSSSSSDSPYPVLFVMAEKLVVTGEFYSGPKVLVYDPKKDVWSDEKTGPMVFCNGAGLMTSGVYAPQRTYFLGYSPGSTFREVITNQAYDFTDNTWTIGEAMPTPRLDFGAATVDDFLYVIGGYTYTIGYPFTTASSALNEVYVPFGFRSIPVVGVVSPLSEVVYSVSSVGLVFVVDRPVSQLYFCVDGGVNVTFAGNTTLSGLSGGVHSVTVFAEDKFGNVGVSETVVFSVVSESDPIFTVPVVVVLCVVSVLAVAVLLLFLRRRRSVKSLPMG